MLSHAIRLWNVRGKNLHEEIVILKQGIEKNMKSISHKFKIILKEKAFSLIRILQSPRNTLLPHAQIAAQK